MADGPADINSALHWAGLDALFDGIDRIGERADLAAKEILVESAAVVIRKAQGNFEGVRHRVPTGKGYRYDPPQHVGGSKPNIITGQTRRSIRMNPIVALGKGNYMTKVGPTVAWGRALELGYNGSPGYPFFEPAVTDSIVEMERIRQDTFTKYFL